MRDHPVALFLQRRELGFERVEPRLARVVGLLRERGLLDLELADAPLDDVDLERHRVDLDAQARRGLVDEVDRLVGQLATGDVAVGEHRGGDERGVLDAHAVVDLVALLQAAQDRDRVLDRRLADVHLLEPALERGVLLDVLAVLVERRRADEAQLAAASIGLIMLPASTAPSAPPAPTIVCNSSMNVTISPSASAISLSTDLKRSSNSPRYFAPATIEPMSSAISRLLRRPSGTSPSTMRRARPFDDRGLADAGLADQHRVVLRAARQHLDDAPDLLVAPDDRVDLALARGLGEVAAVLLERLVLLLGVVARDAVRAAHLAQRVEHRVALDAGAAHEVADTAGHFGHREEDVLGGEVVVVEGGALGVGRFEQAVRLGREAGLADGRAAHLRPLRERLVDAGPHLLRQRCRCARARR